MDLGAREGDPVIAGEPPAGQPPPFRQLSFHGNGGTLFGIYVVNLLRTLLTLGVYFFWGKVKARSYLLSELEFEKDRFAYHATGKELLVGWLKVLLFFGLVGALEAGVELLWKEPAATIVRGVVSLGIFFVLIPLAIVGALRFRLSRTSWRGIRFSFRGRAREYLKIYLPGIVLSIVTFGLYYPFFRNNIRRFVVSHSHFGTKQFDYDGRGRDLFGPYLLAWGSVLAVPLVPTGVFSFITAVRAVSPGLPVNPRVVLSLGVPLAILIVGASWLWFIAKQQRYYWDHTSFATAQFHSSVTAGRLFRLLAGDAIRLVPTLGLAWPWVLIRHLRFTCANLRIEGALDLDAIQQQAQAASATGEEFADFVGVFDFSLGL